MQTFRKFCVAIIATLLLCSYSKAQIQVLQKNVLAKIQNGHTHVIVPSRVFTDADNYEDVFKKYFNVTQGVDFVSADNVVGNLAEGDSYFTLETAIVSSSSGATAIYEYLNLWQPTKKMLKEKKFNIYHENALARIPISYDTEGIKAILKATSLNFDGDGHFCHWNPGIIKNYLQQLCSMLKSGKKSDFDDDITNKATLKELSTKTLYCPEDNFTKVGLFVKAGKTVDEKDVFEDYKFEYKPISDQDLSEKILSEREAFYYLIFLRNVSSRLIEVVNSQTGDVVYLRYNKLSLTPNLKSGDLKDLYKTIKKS